MRVQTIAVACAVALIAGVAYTQQTPAPKANSGVKLDSVGAKVSYGIGLNIGENLKQMQQSGAEVNADVVYQGIKDALGGKEPALSEEEIEAAMQQFQRKIAQKQAEARLNANPELKALAEKQKQESQQFLAENKQKKEVKTTKSGLQYLVLKEGTGKSPTANDVVQVHYEGKLLDKTTFDSSYQRGEPAQFPVQAVIPGWTEALQMMKVGGKWRLFIPPDLAYGVSPPPGGQIPPNAVLVFDVELLDIVQNTPPAGGQEQPRTQQQGQTGQQPRQQAQQPRQGATKK